MQCVGPYGVAYSRVLRTTRIRRDQVGSGEAHNMSYSQMQDYAKAAEEYIFLLSEYTPHTYPTECIH